MNFICWYVKPIFNNNKKSNNTSQNLTKGLHQLKIWNFRCKSDKTKKRKLNPESKNQSSLFQHWSQYPNHIQNQKGENTQVYKWISSSNTIQIPTFSHSETNAVELFQGNRKKALQIIFFKWHLESVPLSVSFPGASLEEGGGCFCILPHWSKTQSDVSWRRETTFDNSK